MLDQAALGLCYNKALVRAIAAAADVPVPLETYLAADDQAATIPSIFPALIKPCLGDSSIGITKEAVVDDPVQAIAYVAELRALLPGRPVLIQEFLSGAEYSVALIGNPGMGLTALPILEVDYSRLNDGLPKILGYESKWDPTSPYWTDIRYREAMLEEPTAAQPDRLVDDPVRASRLPRLCPLRLPRRPGRHDQAARGQPQSRLVLGWQGQPHGGYGRLSLCRPPPDDHRGGLKADRAR